MTTSQAPSSIPVATVREEVSFPRTRAGRRSRGARPVLYDFRRPTKLSREQARSLQIVAETFARQYTTLLTSTLRAVAQVSPVGVAQVTYDEYVAGLANPTVLALLSVEPLAGTAILEFSLDSAMRSIDHLLGGPGAEQQPTRALTEIEAALLRSLIDRILGEMRYAFEPVVRLHPRLSAVEYNPQFVQAAGPADMVVVLSFEVRIGTQGAAATICLPYAALVTQLGLTAERAMGSEREREAREAARAQVARRLRDVPVETAVCFAPVRLTPAQVLALAPGDILPLGHPTRMPLRVTAADVTFAHAVPGSRGRRVACRVVENSDETRPEDLLEEEYPR
ncbi:MAG: flagellar motor switch protein FliM [Actinomycetes bacterium]